MQSSHRRHRELKAAQMDGPAEDVISGGYPVHSWISIDTLTGSDGRILNQMKKKFESLANSFEQQFASNPTGNPRFVILVQHGIDHIPSLLITVEPEHISREEVFDWNS